MISMSVIHSIRSMRKEGCSIAAIARELHVSEPTVRKYLKAADLSPKPPVTRSRPSKIDPWVPLIEQWLAEDRESWSKQRHTATRIHERLVREHGADVSLSTVTRKVNELKGRFRLDRERGFLDLSWHEGEAQADFGQTDVWWRGARRRMHYFVLSFPYSNTAVACLTPGENAECACAALRWLFERLGGVPRRIVFDNAAGVGRKRKDGSVRYTGLFAGFRAHYGFDSTLCNPYSGHEKGNMQSKVGAIRRALFVPVPKAYGYESFNADLFERCMAMADKPHYRKGKRESRLFEHDRAALLPLPDSGFDPVTYKRMKADKYGALTLEGRHRYFTGVEHAGLELIVGLRAETVEILDTAGRWACTSARTGWRPPAATTRCASSRRLSSAPTHGPTARCATNCRTRCARGSTSRNASSCRATCAPCSRSAATAAGRPPSTRWATCCRPPAPSTRPASSCRRRDCAPASNPSSTTRWSI